MKVEVCDELFCLQLKTHTHTPRHTDKTLTHTHMCKDHNDESPTAP